jgi:6-phosphogluconolactonase (cycloisomerase 2 family)
MKLRWLVTLIAGMLFIGISAFANAEDIGAVFVGTNHNNTMDASQPPNQIAMYLRFGDGSLSLLGYFNTGGQGSGPSKRFAGDGLGAAHSVQLSTDHKWLFVTNAGSNNVSVFRVTLGNDDERGHHKFFQDGLALTDVQSTGDGSPGHRFPNSVTQYENLVYVLNAADQGSITGYRLTGNGKLVPIPHSTRTLNANQTYPPDTLYNPVQVSFTPDGKHLVVTIKDGPAAGLIPGVTPTGPGRALVFDVNADGRPSENYTQTDFQNHGPFGFSFDRHGNMLVALFVGGPNLTAAAGSFRFHDDDLIGITPDVPNGQLDTCWLENNGKYAYGANYSSGTVTSYTIGSNGSLTLLQAVAGSTDSPGNVQGSTPLDIRVSPNEKFVYDVLPGSGKVAGWRINGDGSLTKIGEYGGLPQTVNGDMAPEERFGPGGSPAGIDVL